MVYHKIRHQTEQPENVSITKPKFGKNFSYGVLYPPMHRWSWNLVWRSQPKTPWCQISFKYWRMHCDHPAGN